MHCNAAATETPCTARKYVENDRCHKTITVIYLYKHSCNPRQAEEKPKKETLEDILRSQPTKTAGQIQLDVIREASLSDKCGAEVNNVALSYSNRTHIQYAKNTINKEKRPGGSDIEAIRFLREDFISRGVDENFILDVILSSEHKIRLGAKITLGLVDEPVSLDGCESVASNYTELEMTTHDPVLRQNVKLVSVYVPKPGENSENVKLMVEVFDKAVNNALPSVAEEYGIANVDYVACGLDPKSYVGDEGAHFAKDFV